MQVDAVGVPRVIEVNGEPNLWRVGKPSSDYVTTKNRMTEDLARRRFRGTHLIVQRKRRVATATAWMLIVAERFD